jgi:hypothetical protein
MLECETKIKLIITYRNGGKALFKPLRFARDVETIPDHFYVSDYARHHAEIAAFHLDSVLGFHNVPPTIGRQINMTSEIKNVADLKLVKSFFMSPVDNVCFHCDCTHYCDINHAICGKRICWKVPSPHSFPPTAWPTETHGLIHGDERIEKTTLSTGK